VLADLLGTFGAETVLWLFLEEAVQKVFEVVGQVVGDVSFSVFDFIKELIPVLTVKRRQPTRHLKYNGP
jgi:hypothetical protein